MQKNRVVEWIPGAAAVVALVIVFFSPWIFSGKVLAPFDILEHMLLPWRGETVQPSVHNHFVSDAITQYIPYRIMAAESFSEDGYIGWNPFVAGGVDQSANTMALTWDWSTQLYRFTDLWTAWHLGRIGQFLIAGFGMIVFLRSRGCAPGVAVFGAVAYMGNWQFVAWIYHQWALASFCWLPWLLWSLHAAGQGSRKQSAVSALFVALALAGATLQHAAFICLVLLCVWTGWCWERRANFRACHDITIATLASGFLGAGLVAVVLEPSIDAFWQNLQGGHVRGELGYKQGLLQPVLNLAGILFYPFPYVLGSVQTIDLWKLLKTDLFDVPFFGTVPVLLSAIAFFSRRVPMAAKLLMVSGLVLPLTPLVGPLYHRVGLVWILGGCWASCAWLSTVDASVLRKTARKLCVLFIFFVLLWLGASFVLALFQGWLEPVLREKAARMGATGQFGLFSLWMENRATALLDYLRIWHPSQLLAVGGVALSLWGLGHLRSGKAWRNLAAAVGVAMQLSVFWWQWTTWSSDRDGYEQPSLVSVLQNEIGRTGRLAQIPGGIARVVFPPNTLVPSGVAVSGCYDSIQPNGMRCDLSHAWSFPGTTHFLGSLDADQPTAWREVWTDGRWALFRNPDPVLGVATSRSGFGIPLRPEDLIRDTPNSMQVAVPSYTQKLEVFSNWHRGWKFRDGPEGAGIWKATVQGPTKGTQIVFERPTESAGIVCLRFDPSPPDWVSVVTGLSAILIAALALSDGSRQDTNVA